jgi:hypothetical protein
MVYSYVFNYSLKNGFSSKDIQKELVLKRYETACSVVYKLQKGTVNVDVIYILEEMIEFYQGYFIIESSEIE